MPHSDRITAAQAERKAEDGTVFGSDHHRADDEDLGVGEDSDSPDEPSDNQQRVPAGREGALQRDPGFDLGPNGRELVVPPAPGRSAVGQRGDGGVDVLQHDRAALFQPEVAQVTDYFVGRPVQHIEVHGVPIRVADRPGQHREVHDRGLGAEHGHEDASEVGRAHHP